MAIFNNIYDIIVIVILVVLMTYKRVKSNKGANR